MRQCRQKNCLHLDRRRYWRSRDDAGNQAPGDLRGFSIFRETRVSAAELEQLRADYRQRYKIGAVMAPDGDGANVVRRLG